VIRTTEQRVLIKVPRRKGRRLAERGRAEAAETASKGTPVHHQRSRFTAAQPKSRETSVASGGEEARYGAHRESRGNVLDVRREDIAVVEGTELCAFTFGRKDGQNEKCAADDRKGGAAAT